MVLREIFGLYFGDDLIKHYKISIKLMGKNHTLIRHIEHILPFK